MVRWKSANFDGCSGVKKMDKAEIRREMIGWLKRLDFSEKQAIEEKLQQILFSSGLWKNAGTVGVTVSQHFEWDTKRIIETGWAQGKTICVPKCVPKEKELVFYRLDDFAQLEKSFFNLLEPKPEETAKIEKQAIDLLIVPGLVFDKKGFRIGFGGGYYDRFLAGFPNQTVSLVHSYQLKEHVPSESYDIPVRQIVTETGMLKGNGGIL
ncbi:5-formyltetrahydrofolate cyclo-ligase [Heyndrickxia coagulans]|uniref:5-formyltetrahydrofolate cyclo-ligase n=1 Tax=Heyndrickxia coagulans TaxID=1398 RepID=UPI0004A37168|nr:5-formyltetrahydrofolate cyclo-ligase [Heyndrickxia coagulans]MCR2845291.1 5-formyltetrahydrofolate cyclo-ligase [Heyndrickxia coagulans]MDR4222993.1 5-formyltetrahydrofolate cyclo-ligase [Heyndrickxia coagulans DSM 1 = ATCC 7050]MED4494904.1 5-formyltetrahydrofolate cyclo-ligase [Heyndrickxia coagulans]MED4537740.1 5-formyltetrahydrofolate cyclo-ligase [Heyndrickxia coagulans]MED4966601.1 5-formyltetrahydrofolate cyclo-ligase [Heyndrickxia coagulans]